MRNFTANLLIFLVLMLISGCGITNFSKSGLLEIKPFEEKMEEYHKNYQVAKELTLETEISSQIVILGETPHHDVKYMKANLNILPMNDGRQKISNLEIIPNGKIVGHSLEFKIDTPSAGWYEFKLKADAVLRYEFFQVTEKLPFPLQAIPTEQIQYTRPSLVIDSDDKKISDLALSIANGEDDLYRVVFKVSKWVRENVHTHIDVSTVTTSQKASWVLEHRKGVCDEKTNIFIGILRSLGIPAKFIIGLVGTNYQDPMNLMPRFKMHGWAEVYFPSVGWIPFDVAYNQLGFIDATHIKLTETVDTSDALTSYEWKSSNAIVSVKDLEIKTIIKQTTGMINPLLEIKSKVWYRDIDMESYNVVEATIKNPHKFYVITNIYLKTTHDIEIIDENIKMLLMEPNTKKTVYWIVRPTIDLDRRMAAIFPIDIVSFRNVSSSLKLKVAKEQGYPKISLEKLKNKVNRKIKDSL